MLSSAQNEAQLRKPNYLGTIGSCHKTYTNLTSFGLAVLVGQTLYLIALSNPAWSSEFSSDCACSEFVKIITKRYVYYEV